MHFHLPRPLHGWREFAGEVGIIVLGVLIALAFEQAVDNWQWHRKVAVVRKSLLRELANDRARWEVDVAVARCSARDIDKLDRWAVQAGAMAAPPTPALQSGNIFWMHSANWNLATGSQTLDHFPIDEQLALAALYDGIAHRQINLGHETDLDERVAALAPLANNEQTRHELREALSSLRQTIGALLNNAGYMRRHFDAVGVKADRADFAAEFPVFNC